MEDVMVTCEDDSMEEDEEEQEVQIIAIKDEGKKQPAATRCAPASAKKSGEPARGKPEPPRAAPTPQPKADPVDSEDEMEEEAAAEQPDQCSKRQNQATKKLPADEKRGRAYHEINEEAFFDRNDKIPAYNNILDGVKDELVCLDASTCDLQFKMDKERYGGRPLLYSIFPFLWSGSKATHGLKKGKVYFEIKRTDNLPLKEGYTEFPLLRVGWSVARSGPQLGEDDLSFAYDSRGLKATSGRFETYGKSFREYDLIGCYADLDGDSVEISFSKNGEDLGQAFHFNKSSLGDHALLPHIICKGCSFQVNFGQKLKPWHKPSEGFRFLHDLKSEDLIRTPVPPRSKKACEMLMMVGFPASGKTTWALKHIQENPDKNYIHLSVDRFISQVKTVGLDEPEYNNKVLDQHIKMATKCLRRALPIAGSRKANYIIDQCSMDRNAQQWKLLCFTGFTCKAVLLVPEEEEWERRLEERRKEGEIYPESVLVRMKANLWVPKMNKTTLSEIITPELWKTGSQKYLFKLKMEAKVNPLNPRKGIKFTPKATSKKNVQDSRPHPYRAPVPLMSSWRPRAGGFQNSRSLSPPRQDRFFGRNNDLPENRQGFQNSRALSPPRQDRFFGRNNDLPENRPGFQNSRALSPPRQDRFFGRNNDLPENRPGFQNSRALSPPRQDRFFGRNNDLPENRPGFQNSRALSPPRQDRFFGRNNALPENRQGFQNSRALSPPRQNTLFGRINDLLENRPGFQNSRALSPPQQNRLFGRNNDLPENRQGFQNSRALSPPQQNRLFGRNNDLPENRQGFQNSRALSPPRQDRFFGRNNDLPENRPFLQDFDGRMPDRANDWFRSL